MHNIFSSQFLGGKVVAITNADKGYGRLISSAFARAGARVVLIGNNTEALSSAASLIGNEGDEVIPLKADVSVPLDWISTQDRIIEIFGALDGVVHLADKRSNNAFPFLTENEWLDMFRYNVYSTMSISQALARKLPDTWLTIVGPHLDETGLQIYPQRSALSSLTTEANSEDLRINLVMPGRASCGEEDLDTPVASTILMLASKEMSHTSGLVLKVPLAPAPKIKTPDIQYLY